MCSLFYYFILFFDDIQKKMDKTNTQNAKRGYQTDFLTLDLLFSFFDD